MMHLCFFKTDKSCYPFTPFLDRLLKLHTIHYEQLSIHNAIIAILEAQEIDNPSVRRTILSVDEFQAITPIEKWKFLRAALLETAQSLSGLKIHLYPLLVGTEITRVIPIKPIVSKSKSVPRKF
jgi:hypothetical protein